jgi:capsular exopolysaccharide synthesis family protein
MSRLYDALKQTENAVVRMIEGEQSSQPSPSDHIEVKVPVEPEILAEHFMPEANVDDMSSVAPPPVSERGYRVVKVRARATMPVLPFDGSDQRTAECYRILRTNILHHPARPRMIAISSAGPGDGKTTSAINIAGALALKQDMRVLLVEGDLRHGSIASKLGIEATPGLAEVLTGQCSLEEAIVQTENLPNLHILPGGRTLANPAELLDSAGWRAMAQDLREEFQFIVVDTTPIGVVADYDLIQAVCDGTVVVVRPDHTDRLACMKAIQSIQKGKLLGALLNHTEDWFLWRIRDYYGYYGKS